MRRFFGAVLVLLLLPASARAAQPAPFVRVYARALRAFNGSLSETNSRALAGRLIAEADRAGLDARLVVALVAIESRWHPAAVSPAGAAGLGQLMPATARSVGVDALDASENLHGTIAYLAMLVRSYGAFEPNRRYALALGAYNAGPGAVARFGGVPPYHETQLYVRDVLLLWRRLAGAS